MCLLNSLMLKCSACNQISLLATKQFKQHDRLSAVLCYAS